MKGVGNEGHRQRRVQAMTCMTMACVTLLRVLRPDVGDLGSLWVGRVTWTGSAWGPGSLLGDSTMYEYYYGR